MKCYLIYVFFSTISYVFAYKSTDSLNSSNLSNLNILPLPINSSEEISSSSAIKSSYLPSFNLTDASISNPNLHFLNDPNNLALLGINSSNQDVLQDAVLTTPQLIAKYQYPVEIHSVTTDDDYILEMHRIPGSPLIPPRVGKIVAFLQHGILDSSSTWVVCGPKQGLAYLLADLGYDVWLGNVRGNRYSRKNNKYDPDGSNAERKPFWNFTFNEMGTYDVPAMIDYITNKTGQPQMHYIGHSQGTTIFFVMTSERPEYNDRIFSMNALAPIAFVGDLPNILLSAVDAFLLPIEVTTKLLEIYEFAPHSKLSPVFGETVCKSLSLFKFVCTNIIFLLFGYDSTQLDPITLPAIVGSVPAGTSTKDLFHFGQLVHSKDFRKFDYGIFKNQDLYGSYDPPSYNLSNVRAPVGLHYGLNDALDAPKNVAQLRNQLPNVIAYREVPYKKWNHIDFTWGKDARTLVYDEVVKIMKLFEK